jgi:hypothetical protein
VLRFGKIVICAADAAWTYDGPSPILDLPGVHLASEAACPPTGCRGTGSQQGGVFEATGRVIVNGLELEPENGKRNTWTVDTSTGSVSGTFNCCGGTFDALYNVSSASRGSSRIPSTARSSVLST